ncbi:type II secretion system minor pseudopilin GspK [Vibrio sp.]|uniref:Type II secretion system protein K n=1 Tax=Vibrio viridaestus TaxID=2487322 RepID=A0A3N9TBA3_9VIBR|nr:type II secretion system minor pseudopilin GspK [Vibrio viridaestus]MDC0610013.1 type II secretion system minor pseudopilin GspK [Vibrio sp.]RQW61389.1 general secretion pathway protein GspK [Vibrio viridaestus]
MVKRKQAGVALLIVMLILAMMVSIAATMTERLFVQFKRATHQTDYQQAYWYALGVEGLAEAAIKQSFKDSDNTNLSQPWAVGARTYPLDYGQVTGRIVDKQACFNINVLNGVSATGGSNSEPYLVQVLQHIIESTSVDSYEAQVAAESAWEYLDSDLVVNSNYGVEDRFYESTSPSYVTPNGLLADASEIRAIQNIGGKSMGRLMQLICALPVADWRLNVNTVAEEQWPLLAALFYPYLSEDAAKSIIQERPSNGWASLDEFIAISPIASIDSNVLSNAIGYLTVDSAFFELDARVDVNQSQIRIRSLMYSGNRKNVNVVRRRFGGVDERIINHPDK